MACHAVDVTRQEVISPGTPRLLRRPIGHSTKPAVQVPLLLFLPLRKQPQCCCSEICLVQSAREPGTAFAEARLGTKRRGATAMFCAPGSFQFFVISTNTVFANASGRRILYFHKSAL